MPSRDEKIEEFTNALAQVIRDKRLAMNLSMNRLAQESGLAVQTIAFIEKGERKPGIDTIARIAPVLGTTPSKLIADAERVCDF